LYCLEAGRVEAGCDEAGRGCLAGPVFAAAVILPEHFRHEGLTDSKQLTGKQRDELREVIEREALCYAVAMCTPEEIDELNILWASVRAMHKALSRLSLLPDHILVDGNRFKPYESTPHTCVVRATRNTSPSRPLRSLQRPTATSTCARCTRNTRCTTGKATKGTPPGRTAKR